MITLNSNPPTASLNMHIPHTLDGNQWTFHHFIQQRKWAKKSSSLNYAPTLQMQRILDTKELDFLDMPCPITCASEAVYLGVGLAAVALLGLVVQIQLKGYSGLNLIIS